MSDKTLTLALMDPPYESANSTTALRIVSAALKKGINVNVFAYEGAVNLPFKDQAPHANPVKGTTVEERRSPDDQRLCSFIARDWKRQPPPNLAELRPLRGRAWRRQRCRWGVKRGGPADFLRMAQESTNTLVIPTK